MRTERPAVVETEGRRPSIPPFATAHDHAECRRLHRLHGTTYYLATRVFPARLRRRVHALYGFVRVPDEWVDNPGGDEVAVRRARLESFRSQLLRGLDGVRPEEPVLRAFCDVCREVGLSLDEPLCFLDAMAMDLETARYPTYEHLRTYMRGSACAVGLMMCALIEAPLDPEVRESAMALGEAMQLTNFLRDVAEDLERGRIYLPQEDMETFGVAESQLLQRRCDDRLRDLMRFEIARARALYEIADAGIPLLPRHARKPVRLARELYAAILGRIERQDLDPFRGRARTTRAEKAIVAARVISGRR